MEEKEQEKRREKKANKPAGEKKKSDGEGSPESPVMILKFMPGSVETVSLIYFRFKCPALVCQDWTGQAKLSEDVVPNEIQIYNHFIYPIQRNCHTGEWKDNTAFSIKSSAVAQNVTAVWDKSAIPQS